MGKVKEGNQPSRRTKKQKHPVVRQSTCTESPLLTDKGKDGDWRSTGKEFGGDG